jgi:spore coat protein U-like protein
LCKLAWVGARSGNIAAAARADGVGGSRAGGGDRGDGHDHLRRADHDFGSVGVIGASGVDATSTITVQCTTSAPYTIGLNAGTGAGATVATRLMTSGASNTVSYSLYQDVAHSLVWGTTIGTNTVAGTGNGASQAFTVYGHVPSQTTPPAAVYNDTITVTVTC